MSNNPSKLVACFVELSSNKERTTLEQSVVKTLSELLECDLYLLQLYNGRGEFEPDIRFCMPADDTLIIQEKPRLLTEEVKQSIADYLAKIEAGSPTEYYRQQGKVFWPLYVHDTCLDMLILERTDLSSEELNLLSAIGAIFNNYMALLEVGERDALTSLYNRRVFDTRLKQLSKATSPLPESNKGERRHIKQHIGNFLGIIDIDYFKRVNDDFGHLFGDEVLLWLARKMRECFRNEDALFRYGGEEFAVLLSGLNQQQAMDTFERFRKSVASTDFPQIGRVTVSIGFAQIDAQANPTLVFGMADKALYYAKEHGRNRVESFEQLVHDQLIDVEIEDKDDIELF